MQNPLQALLVVYGRFKSMLKSGYLKPTIGGNHSKINHAGRCGRKQRLAWKAKIDSRLAIDHTSVQPNPALGGTTLKANNNTRLTGVYAHAGPAKQLEQSSDCMQNEAKVILVLYLESYVAVISKQSSQFGSPLLIGTFNQLIVEPGTINRVKQRAKGTPLTDSSSHSKGSTVGPMRDSITTGLMHRKYGMSEFRWYASMCHGGFKRRPRQ